MIPFLLVPIIGYLLGSIPFGYILVRLFRGEDIRTKGSGNIGATNVARSSPALGVVTLLLDASKGLAAVAIARWLYPEQSLLTAVAALAAVVGHIFTLWLKFKGGKGVATGLGAFIGLAPKAVLIAGGIFVICVLACRYVSLASIVCVGFFPLVMWLVNSGSAHAGELVLTTIASALIVAKHIPNIARLRAGTESRISLASK